MSLVELRTYYDRFEAEIVCGRLRSEGLDAMLFDVGLAATHGALPVRAFADLCAGRAVQNASDARVGLRVTGALDALYRAAASGRVEAVG